MVISKCFSSISEFLELDGFILFFYLLPIVTLFLIHYAPVLEAHVLI